MQLKDSKPAIIGRYIAADLRTSWQSRRGIPDHTSGSTHIGMDVAASVEYIDRVYRDYFTYGEIVPGDIAGKRVLELGPGDNFGVALRFIADGADQVVALDRFYSRRDPEQQRRIYAALLDTLSPEQRRRAEGAIAIDSPEVQLDPARIRYVHGTGIEEGADLLGEASFDLVVSRAVLEHVYDTNASFDAMDSLLRPGGRMLHKVDFRDHGMFSAAGHNPLTFLTIPDRTYRWMTYRSGRPNRRLIDWYRAKVASLGYEARLLTTHLVGREEEVEPHQERVAPADWPPTAPGLIAAIRSKLDRPFRDLSDDDLVVQGLFLVAEKHVG